MDPEFADNASSFNSALNEIRPANIRNTTYTRAPEERFKLGTWSVMGLVLNRVIGSGIFMSPSTAMRGTNSVGVTLLFWFAGAIWAVTGTFVYIELGLNIPRHRVDGQDIGIPRSGGVVNYLQYAFSWPAYRPGIVQLVTCIYGLTYVTLGNVAGNCLIFGTSVLMAANRPVTNGAVRAIAISMATIACFVHAFSRRGGIYLGNIFALVKVLILLLIFVTAMCAVGGVFHSPTYGEENLGIRNSFANASTDSYGYAQGFLAILFAFTGFEQPNYVLGETRQPFKTFPRGSLIAVAIVVVLYILVNISYMLVVPKSDQLNAELDIAQQFFQLTYNNIANSGVDPQRIMSAFIAISTFGTIFVMTFAAARVKQAIALEGILPWPNFFGSTKNWSLGRVLELAHKKRNNIIVRSLWWLLKMRWMHPLFMIIVTVQLTPLDAYGFLVGIYSYAVVSAFNFLVAITVLKLRLSSRERWREKSTVNPYVSIVAATVFGIGSIYPLVAIWVPPRGPFVEIDRAVPWFTVPTVGCCVLAFGGLWYLGFLSYAARRLRKDRVEFKVEKLPDFDREPHPDGPFVQVHEEIYMAWVAKEVNESSEDNRSLSSRESF